MKITPLMIASMVGGEVEGDKDLEITGFAKIEEAVAGKYPLYPIRNTFITCRPQMHPLFWLARIYRRRLMAVLHLFAWRTHMWQ